MAGELGNKAISSSNLKLKLKMSLVKNVSRDSRDKKVSPHWVQDQPWSFNGPYRAPKIDFEIVEPFSGLVCYFYIIYTL